MNETKQAARRYQRQSGPRQGGAANSHPYQHYSIGHEEKQGPVHATNGRVVGEVRAGVFRKTAQASRHMLRRPPAWALDIASLDEAEALGAARVRIRDTESGRLYLAPISLIRHDGFRLNRGHGQQLALGLEFWQVTAGNGGVPVQLALGLLGGGS